MAIKYINMNITGQVGVLPRLGFMQCDDSFSDVIAANYLKSAIKAGMATFYPTDMILVTYSDNATQLFKVSISGSTITLIPNASEVTLPVTSGNIAAFSGTNGNLANGPVAANKVLTSGITTPDVGANLISFDVTVGFAALASDGSVTLINSSGAKQYKVRSLQLNSGGTNFSGGGGDRLGQVTDGTTVYSVIPAVSMQTLANAQWGATALPNPASAAINTSTAAGENLVFKYSGGTTDYTAGSLVISGIVERVA